MANKPGIEDTVLSSGQNEGFERAVLPLPQLLSVVNARLRKTARWGKRFGLGRLSQGNLSVNPGYARGLGEGFAIVDDQCNRYDRSAADWVDVASTDGDPFRVPGAVSGWLPERAYFPLPVRVSALQTTTPCDTAFFLGYLWSVKQVIDPANAPNTMLRIVATDPDDQTLIFLQDLPALGTPLSFPRLTVVGPSLVLSYQSGSNGLHVRAATDLTGFGAATVITSSLSFAYDISLYAGAAGGLALFAFTTAGGITIGTLDPSLTVTGTANIAEAGAQSVSIVGDVATRIYVAYGLAGSSRIRVYSLGFALTGGPTNLSTIDNFRPLLALLPNGNARVVHSAQERTFGMYSMGAFRVLTVDTTGAIITSASIQNGAYPIAIPFTIGTRVYLWCQLMINQPVTGSAGFPVLLRIDVGTAEPGQANFSFPIEMSLQDFITATGVGFRTTELRGLPRVADLGNARRAALIPIIYRAPLTAGDIQVDHRLVIARQFTEPPGQRGLTSFAADSAAFVPAGALSRVDARGAVETGFVHTPQLGTPVPGSTGGGLTPSRTYYYAAIFTSRNDSGRVELSGPSLPAKAVLGAGQNTVSLQISTLYLSGRPSASIELYRTLGDTQSFYLIATLAARPDVDAVTFADTIPDSVIATQPVLYTQVGQQLGNGFPPASRFGCTGGGRVFVAGCLRPDVAVASKLILGDQSPTFCESDAFKLIMPAAISGIAWMDSLTLFTAEGIYVASGDGPTDDGVGDFGTPSRLPFQIGCIEPRSVITVDEGTFFQSKRGLYLLPRGFGAPVPAGDAVMLTLQEFPIITSAIAMVKRNEQTIRWTCMAAVGIIPRGRTIVYDLVHKAWSIDITDNVRDGFPDGAAVCSGNWFDGEIASADPDVPAFIQATNDTFVDQITSDNRPIEMLLETADLRLFGLQSRGAGSRLSILSELRSPCTLHVQRLTDRGSSPATPRVFTGAFPDDGVGSNNYTQVDLGSGELRSITALRVRMREKSDVEGIALIGLSIEHGPADGLRLDKPADRIV